VAVGRRRALLETIREFGHVKETSAAKADRPWAKLLRRLAAFPKNLITNRLWIRTALWGLHGMAPKMKKMA
ncbi:hypothetical protein, partial [Caballeronia sp.]|uniref:hypothetical protein n=1 Tax=Caballeronia sp. TaxID=1931223 RepID=UPI003C576371